jgi:hypothetical protein
MIALSQETAHRWTREYVCASNALCMSCACLMGWPGYQDADSMSRRTVRWGVGPASAPGSVRALRASVRCGGGRV